MNYISSKNYEGIECILVSTENNCPIELGDIVKDVLGDNVIVKGGIAPGWPDSSGSVHFSYEYSPIRDTTHPLNILAQWKRLEDLSIWMQRRYSEGMAITTESLLDLYD